MCSFPRLMICRKYIVKHTRFSFAKSQNLNVPSILSSGLRVGVIDCEGMVTTRPQANPTVQRSCARSILLSMVLASYAKMTEIEIPALGNISHYIRSFLRLPVITCLLVIAQISWGKDGKFSTRV